MKSITKNTYQGEEIDQINYTEEECRVHAWHIKSKHKNCGVEVVKREIPFVWHSKTILLRFLQNLVYKIILQAYEKVPQLYQDEILL